MRLEKKLKTFRKVKSIISSLRRNRKRIAKTLRILQKIK